MSWLLAEMGLALLLAALAGWFVGWYLRAFRDQDRIEDLRQTMLATKDVKDRELNELRRQAEDLETRLARTSETDARAVAAIGSASATTVEVARAADHTQTPSVVSSVAPPVQVSTPTEIDGAPSEPGELAGVAAAERERRREADAALRRKTAAMLTFQAEIEALREALAEKAGRIAELQERLVGAEPAGVELESSHQELAKLEARLRVLDNERAAAVTVTATRDAELLDSRKEIVIRDTRINDLRNRCASLESELDSARSGAVPSGGEVRARLESSLEDARRALQRQIDRNRKQEAVHRAVVEQLEGDKAHLRAASPPPWRPSAPDAPPAPAPDAPDAPPAPASARRGLPQKRSDELTQISGIGPAFAKALRETGIDTYAQIATWIDGDVERYAAAIGAHAKRIRTDRWVEQAHDLARTSRALRD